MNVDLSALGKGPVAATSFCLVEGLVGGFDEVVGGPIRLCVRAQGGDADAGGDAPGGGGTFVGDVQRLNGGANILGYFAGGLFVGVAEDHRELLAAIPRHQVAGAAGKRLQRLADSAQAFVAGHVTVNVVVKLEEIDVQKRHGHRLAETPATPPFVFEEVVEPVAVGDAGQAVENGEFLDPDLHQLAFGDVLVGDDKIPWPVEVERVNAHHEPTLLGRRVAGVFEIEGRLVAGDDPFDAAQRVAAVPFAALRGAAADAQVIGAVPNLIGFAAVFLGKGLPRAVDPMNDPLRIDHGDLLAQGVQNRNIEIRGFGNIHRNHRSIATPPSDDISGL